MHGGEGSHLGLGGAVVAILGGLYGDTLAKMSSASAWSRGTMWVRSEARVRDRGVSKSSANFLITFRGVKSHEWGNIQVWLTGCGAVTWKMLVRSISRCNGPSLYADSLTNNREAETISLCLQN